MKKLLVSLSLVAAVYAAMSLKPLAQGSAAPAIISKPIEYATVRFMEERTAIMWPDGSLERVADLNPRKKFDNGSEKYPKEADFRMYWMTIAMNAMAQRGYELVSFNDRDLVMKRVPRAN